MKIKGIEPREVVINVKCDGCGESTRKEQTFEYATLSAAWDCNSRHDGECYEIQLCEICFYGVLGHIRELYRANTLFKED